MLAFVAHPGRRPALQAGDAFLLGAVVLCAIGYAEGGALSRTLGGPTTICWALVLAAPLTASVTALAIALTGLHAGATAWLGFAYVAVVSMFLGFFAWYAGLARGGVARIGQVQLAQPVLTLGWSAALLGEQRRRGHAAHRAGGAGLRRGDAARAVTTLSAAWPSTPNAVGKTYPPLTYAVGREKIREYAFAVGETNPLHLEVAGRARRWATATSSRRRCSRPSTARPPWARRSSTPRSGSTSR